MIGQLALDVEPPFHCIAMSSDGRVLDVIPIRPGETWGPAACWATIAVARDRADRQKQDG